MPNIENKVLHISAVSFLSLFFLVYKQTLVKFDYFLTNQINLISNPLFDYFFNFLTLLGSTEFCLIISCGIIAALYKMRKGKLIVLFIGFLGLLYFIEYLGKSYSNQIRPPSYFNNTLLNFGFLAIKRPYCFPSGHMLRFTFLTGFVHRFLLKEKNRACMLFFTLVIFMGLSRVYLGSHWMSDVLGGFLAAIFVLSLFDRSYNKLGLKNA